MNGEMRIWRHDGDSLADAYTDEDIIDEWGNDLAPVHDIIEEEVDEQAEDKDTARVGFEDDETRWGEYSGGGGGYILLSELQRDVHHGKWSYAAASEGISERLGWIRLWIPISKAEEEFVANEVKQLASALGELNRLAKKDPQTWSMGKYRSS